MKQGFLWLFSGVLFLAGCATVEAPSGGPEDKLPPRVAGIYPHPNSVNQSTELLIKVQFDEWISSTVPRSAITISPPIEKKMQFEVDGELLTIRSNATLDSNTTYTVTVASGIKDLRGNAVAKPFQLAFSTGSSIDSLALEGRVMVTSAMIKQKQYPSVGLFLLGKERNSRHYLLKYRDTTNTVPDTVPQLAVEPPLFVTQADSNGWFRLGGLRPGRYRVVAFVDVNGNQRVEPIAEWAGVGEKDIVLDTGATDSLWIALADQDTSLLGLESVAQLGKDRMTAKFSRDIILDSNFTQLKNCRLTKSDSTRLYPVMVYRLPKSADPVFRFNPPPAVDSAYVFSCEQARDSLQRGLNSRLNSLMITWEKYSGDTLAPSIVSTEPASGSKNIMQDTPVELDFGKPVSGDSLGDFLAIVMNRDTMPVVVKRIDPIRFEVRGERPWLTDAKVELLQMYADTTLKSADSSGFRDTVFATKSKSLVRFETVAKLKQASLSGKIPKGDSKTRVRLRSVETGKLVTAICTGEGRFTMDPLLEGAYVMDYYRVREGMDVPYAGRLNPLDWGYPWRSPADTLRLSNGVNVLDSLIRNIPSLP
jgi:hypothetical protein